MSVTHLFYRRLKVPRELFQHSHSNASKAAAREATPEGQVHAATGRAVTEGPGSCTPGPPAVFVPALSRIRPSAGRDDAQTSAWEVLVITAAAGWEMEIREVLIRCS